MELYQKQLQGRIVTGGVLAEALHRIIDLEEWIVYDRNNISRGSRICISRRL